MIGTAGIKKEYCKRQGGNGREIIKWLRVIDPFTEAELRVPTQQDVVAQDPPLLRHHHGLLQWRTITLPHRGSFPGPYSECRKLLPSYLNCLPSI